MTSTAAEAAPYAIADAGAQRPTPWWTWMLAAVILFLAAVAGVLLRPAGTTVAVWWPAAGLSVLFVMLQPRAKMPWAVVIVLVSSIAANLVGGRTLPLAVAFGVANLAEVVAVLAVLGVWRRPFRLSSLRAGLRFAVAVATGAAVVGVLAGAIVMLLEGGDFFPTAGFVAASHAAAVAMLAPFAVLPPRLPVLASRWEIALQATILAAVIVLVFNPGIELPLSFAPYPLVAWAAFRFPIRVVLVETILASVAMLAFSIAGGGPFNLPQIDLVTRAALFETMLVALAAFTVILTAAQYELRAVSRQLEASSHLLSGSVVDSRLGLAVSLPGDEHSRLVWATRAARRLRAGELDGDDWSGPVRLAAMQALRTGEAVSVSNGAGRRLTVAANAIEGEEHAVAVQLLDITSLLRAQQAKVEAEVERDAARKIRAELERQRDDFLATTSHELRTPITSVIGYAELLADSHALEGAPREWVRVIERNAVRLSELVEDLLTLSGGATAPRRPSNAQPIDSGQLLADAAATVRPMSDHKGIDIEVEADGSSLLGARGDLDRAITNVLTNAIKFTPAGGTVRARADAHDGWVRIRITDTGPGMTDDEIVHAFDRFYRAPAAERDNVPGTGLGLAIVAELVRRNGGTVALEAGAAGSTGLTAELRLPATA
ncbi:ATP-binding protein [Agrococcus beijingensis]|uniref:sensor histidine kinase n=1 Tax=Agrococcus beijingensis TaxID=3068634 RepID=UPI0027406F48|nr:ATP-binding protein [Agrococcus sp. REN33]